MQVLIEFDAETLRRLERVAPGKHRKRSAFIRAAVQKAIWELEEQATRRAYVEAPDTEPAPFDATAWEPLPFGGFDPPERARLGSASTRKTKKTKKRSARTKRRSR